VNEQLAQSVRRLIDATIRTQVDVQTVAAVKGKIDWATEQLSAELIPGSFGVHQTSDGRSMALGNVVIGARNPVAPPLAIHDDADGAVRTDFVLGAAHEGPPGMVHGGLWHTADTLPELAAKIVVDADNLVSTVKRFNEFVAAGVDDDFGRGDEAYDRVLGRAVPDGADRNRALSRRPFGLSDLGTKGGLVTDSHARVLDTDGNPISGLYAAGNAMAAVSGTVYPGGGNPIGASMLFSHLAAKHMATSLQR
jgi:hypothetical protein